MPTKLDDERQSFTGILSSCHTLIGKKGHTELVKDNVPHEENFMKYFNQEIASVNQYKY